MRRTRKHIKEGGAVSTDSEDQALAGIKETSKKKRRKGQTNQKESKSKTAGNNRREEGQDSKGLEVSQRSAVTEKRDDQISSARPEQKLLKTTSKVTRLQTEQLRSNKTNEVLGEHCLNHLRWFHGKMEKIVSQFQVDMWMAFNPSTCGISI